MSSFYILLDDNILFQESISKNPNLKPLTQQSYSTTTGSSIKKITAETVGLSELNETRSGITRSLLESMGLLESKDSEWEIKSNFSEDLWTTMFLRRFTIETFFDYDTKILLTETLRFSVIKQLTDPLVLAEALAKKTDFKLEDALALVELFERTLEFRRSLTESISLTELNQRILQLQKIMIELIDLTVLIQKSGQLTLDDSLTLIESLSKKSDLRNLLENVDLVDSKLFDLRKNLGSLVSFAEELSSMTGFSLTETLLLLESFITISDSRIQLTDTSALAETLSKQSKIPFSSMLSLVESIYIGSLLVKELSDIIYVGRTAAKENLLKLIDVRKQASLPISEIIQPIVGFEKTEQISFSETFVKETRKQNIESIQFDYSFLFDETHDLSDVLILTEHLSTQSSRKDILPLLSIAASIKKEITIPRDDVLIITESKIKDFDRPLSESFDLSDLMTKESGKVLIDNLLLTEFLDTIRDFNLTEIITLAESLVKDVDLKQSEIISLIESLRTLTSKELTESLSLVEMISQKTDLNLHDSLSLFETLVKEVGRTRQDSILFTEILSKRAQQRLDDDVNLSDQINTTAVYFLDFVDSFSLIETLTRIHGLSLSDAFTLVESMSISETEPLGRKTLLFTKGQKTILISK